MSPPAAEIEAAFRGLREELGIRSGFPAEVASEAERVARERRPTATEARVDRTDVPFVTIDPPGSRDLDQAVHVERTGSGYRVRYAIADIGFWVDRGSSVEQEAWLRGVTFYAPDHREPLYPPVLSAGVASLLPDCVCPAFLFAFELASGGDLRSWTIERAIVRSRMQLTYTELLDHGTGRSAVAGGACGETLTLLGELGPKLLTLEAERGGVSLPVRDQQVEREAGGRLGYELTYERPSEAEKWNAQVSLVTGMVAGAMMLRSGVGLLRTMPAIDGEAVEKFRRIALTLGFEWAEGTSYGEFLRGVDPAHPHVEVLVRQARRVTRGADYTFFADEPPADPEHGALAAPYAHVTAPLRRLADRYVLELLVTLGAGAHPDPDEMATLERLPAVMNEADRKSGRLDRRVVDIAEAWTLRDRVGDTLSAVVVDVRREEVEVQIEEPPIRGSIAAVPRPLRLGESIGVRVAAVDVVEGAIRLDVADSSS